MDVFVGHAVLALTNDGRVILGRLRGFDQTANCVLEKAQERQYSMEEGVQTIDLGTLILRGDNVACIGEIDNEIDKSVDLSSIKAEPLQHIIHAVF
ncbi:MAG: putative small nuclear ribonucleoprotein splicing factor [Streblomastix strix]|uniref:U6 snRNA-associated Sm-like protein LSm8 n=1 Tax=Streblomastix strix TaxID=222440 RepID=A0A5J4T6F6_9EUKA|nr:MAG: putative small nuclear ribonucleoprotein splicing factor [Streblomastix strix]